MNRLQAQRPTRPGWVSSPTRQCVSDARHARWRARSGITSRLRSRASPAIRMTTPSGSEPTPECVLGRKCDSATTPALAERQRDRSSEHPRRSRRRETEAVGPERRHVDAGPSASCSFANSNRRAVRGDPSANSSVTLGLRLARPGPASSAPLSRAFVALVCGCDRLTVGHRSGRRSQTRAARPRASASSTMRWTRGSTSSTPPTSTPPGSLRSSSARLWLTASATTCS
jgi:hypothetical protein